MKRTYFSGLSLYLILISVSQLGFDNPINIGNVVMPRAASTAVGFASLIAGGLAIVTARRWPPSTSLLASTVGGVLALLTLMAVVLGFLLLAHVLDLPIQRSRP